MSLTPRPPSSSPVAVRRARRSAPRCRGGASSLLRLSQPGQSRLPSSQDLTSWVERAARVLAPAELAAELSLR